MKGKRMIYDCVIIDSELDLLELRMKILKSKIDKFIVVESTKSFSGNPKKLHVTENLNRFSKIANIECHVLDLVGDYTAWQREFAQRDYLRNILHLENDDITFISDVDEIPCIENLFDHFELSLASFILQTSYYYINNVILEPHNHNQWAGTVRVIGKLQHTPQQLRDARWSFPRIFGGYHWSYLGGAEAISNKLNNFAHQEYNNNQFNNKEKIIYSLNQGKEILGRDFKFKIEDLNKFPKEVLDYPQFINYNKL